MSYDILPRGYPTSCSNKEIKKAIEDLQDNISGNSKLNEIVLNRSALIQVGQTELSGRISNRNSRYALFSSLLSLILSISAITLSILSGRDSAEWKNKQLQILESIQNNIVKQ